MKTMMTLEFNGKGELRGVFKGMRMTREAMQRKGYVEINPIYEGVFEFFRRNPALAEKSYVFSKGKIKKKNALEIQKVIQKAHEDLAVEGDKIKKMEIHRLEQRQKEHLLKINRREVFDTRENVTLGIDAMKKDVLAMIDMEIEQERTRIPTERDFPEIPNDFVLQDFHTMTAGGIYGKQD